MKKYLPYIASLTVAVIFGFSFMFTKEALNVLAPFQLLGFRFASAVLLLTLLRIAGLIKVDYRGKKLGKLLLLTAFQPLFYFTCETIGVKLTSASEAGMMIAVIPILAAVLGAIFLKERPSMLQFSFIILSVVGVIFIIYMRGSTQSGSDFTGVLILMGAVLAAAVFNILSRANSLKFTPVEITYLMMWVGAVAFNTIGLGRALLDGVPIVEYFHALTDPRAYFAVLYLAVLSSVLAFFLLNFSLSQIEAAQAAVFANLTTVISILAGVLILKEKFYWFHLLGGSMIILGVWGTNYFLRDNTLPSKVDYLNNQAKTT